MSSTPESRPLVEAWRISDDEFTGEDKITSDYRFARRLRDVCDVVPLIAADRLTEPDLGLSLLRHIMNAGEAVSVPNVLAALRAHLESPDA